MIHFDDKAHDHGHEWSLWRQLFCFRGADRNCDYEEDDDNDCGGHGNCHDAETVNSASRVMKLRMLMMMMMITTMHLPTAVALKMFSFVS